MTTGRSEVACRACGSSALRRLGPCAPIAGEPDDGSEGELLRCETCAFGQRSPFLGADERARIYSSMEATDLDYDFDANCAWSTARSLLRQHHAADAEIRVLDIGCHTGRFLGGLDAGWERFGVEGSPGPAGVAAEERGVTIIAPSLETVDEASADTFDVVTLFDVFEHLPDPVEALERCLALVRPGGLVVLSTGDLDALTWRICGGRHWYLQTSEHISLGSRTFFDWVSRRLAVRPVRVERIAHTRASPAERRRQWVRTLYWQCVVRGGLWRLPQVLMHSVPGLQDLRHMTSVPWSMGLSDHLLVVWERK